MTQVNLLPSDVRSRQRVRRMTGLVVGAVGAVIVLMLMVYGLQTARLAKVNRDVAAQESVNQQLEGDIAKLHTAATLQQDVATRQAMVDELLHGQVLWSDVLRDVSSVMPEGVWLTQMQGVLSSSTSTTVAAPTAPATTGPTSGTELVGTISFQGMAFDHPSVAHWLTHLEKVTGWVNSWVTSSTKQSTTGTTGSSGEPLVTFSGTVDLTSKATVDGRPK